MKQSHCFFCNKDSSVYYRVNNTNIINIDCNTCGIYYISSLAYSLEHATHPIRENTNWLLNIVSETIKLNKSKLFPLWVEAKYKGVKFELDSNHIIKKIFEDYQEIPVKHSEKPTLLLQLFASKLNNKNPFYETKVDLKDLYSIRIDGVKEFLTWVEHLEKENLINISRPKEHTQNCENLQSLSFMITVKGWEKVYSLSLGVNTKKAFIAMSYKIKNRDEIQKTIEGACMKTGHEANTIDKEEFQGGIFDEILAKINQAKFVIAEFTGNNNGVYYESGYAHGCGIPVIYVVSDEDSKKLHFNTRHINYIIWKDYEDLKIKLTNRIDAVINRENKIDALRLSHGANN